MRIFMAGAISGNLSPMWRNIWLKIKSGVIPNTEEELRRFIYEGIPCGNGPMGISHSDIRGGIPNNENISCTRSEQERAVRLGGSCLSRGGGIPNWKPYILESFYYADKDEIQKLMPYFGDFLLDSGAFTFMSNTKTHVDWNDYLERYADFINTYNIDKFFELDIDSVVGYENVLRLRKKLEALTNKQCIPVWHTTRGKREFLKMCDEYPYVAIGGIVSKEIKPSQYQYFPYFINEAHKRGAKIHGLGFTNLTGLKKYHFDSVDSTAWTAGNRFGCVYRFNGETMVKSNKPLGSRVPKEKVRELAVNNFVEWCKFQKYAEVHL